MRTYVCAICGESFETGRMGQFGGRVLISDRVNGKLQKPRWEARCSWHIGKPAVWDPMDLARMGREKPCVS